MIVAALSDLGKTLAVFVGFAVVVRFILIPAWDWMLARRELEEAERFDADHHRDRVGLPPADYRLRSYPTSEVHERVKAMRGAS